MSRPQLTKSPLQREAIQSYFHNTRPPITIVDNGPVGMHTPTAPGKTIPISDMADALYLVLDSNRIIYTNKIVDRLVKKDRVIKTSKHFVDDRALALPAQMFRFGSELIMEQTKTKTEKNRIEVCSRVSGKKLLHH